MNLLRSWVNRPVNEVAEQQVATELSVGRYYCIGKRCVYSL